MKKQAVIMLGGIPKTIPHEAGEIQDIVEKFLHENCMRYERLEYVEPDLDFGFIIYENIKICRDVIRQIQTVLPEVSVFLLEIFWRRGGGEGKREV